MCLSSSWRYLYTGASSDANAAIEYAPMGSDMVEPKDATEIECTLWNASISGCNDALPTLHSSNDNEDEGGEED